MYIKRYTPLKRSKPLQRNKPVVSSGTNSRVVSEEKKYRIPKQTEKLADKMKIYHQIRTVFLSLFNICQAGLSGCSHHATEIHHRKGRGKWLLIIRYFLAVCRNCHDKLGEDSDLAIRNGLSVSRHKVENRYLQPYSADTILVLLKMKAKLTITY